MVTRMTEERFEALAMWCRAPGAREVLPNCSFFSADGEQRIGATFFARDSDLFAYVLLARDAHGQYQGFEESKAFHTLRAAEAAIKPRLDEPASEPTPDVLMRKDTPGKPSGASASSLTDSGEWPGPGARTLSPQATPPRPRPTVSGTD